MNWKTWFPLILAIVLGVVAAKAAHDWVLKNKVAQQQTGQFVKVVVAKADAQAGHELTADDLTLSQVEVATAPASAFKTTDEVVGRVSETFISKGQTLLEPMLAPKGAGSGLQALVPPGMRAITMEVNEFSGVAGLLTPGCHVDIMATVQGTDSNGQITKTIVQDLKVTAVGQRTAAAGDQPPQPNEIFRSVTLLAKPAEAEAIELACSTSRPRLVLRGGRDNEIVASAGISLGELRGNNKDGEKDLALAPTTQPAVAVAPATTQPAAVAIAEPPHRTIKVIRGGQESIVTMPILDAPPSDAFGGTDPSIQPGTETAPASKDPFESK